MAAIDHFLNRDGKVKCWPAKTEGKLAVLNHIAGKMEQGRQYTEKEVNSIIILSHSFGDHVLLRREMVDRGILRRTADGARYWLDGRPEGTIDGTA